MEPKTQVPDHREFDPRLEELMSDTAMGHPVAREGDEEPSEDVYDAQILAGLVAP